MTSLSFTRCHSSYTPADFLATARDKNINQIISLPNLKSIRGFPYFLFLKNKKPFPNSGPLHLFPSSDSLIILFPSWNCHFSVVSRRSKGKCSVCSIYMTIVVILFWGSKNYALCGFKTCFYNIKSKPFFIIKYSSRT